MLFVLGAIGAGVLALFGFSTLASARADATGPDVAVVVFGLATLGWTVFPILGFGNDETLDPQRLATLPLSRRQLVSGVLAASLVGVAPLATLVAFSGALHRLHARRRLDGPDRRRHRGIAAHVRGRVAHARRRCSFRSCARGAAVTSRSSRSL